MSTSSARAEPGRAAGSPAAHGEGKIILVRRIELQRTVARRMMESLREAAQTTICKDVDATVVAEFRGRLPAGTPPMRVTVTESMRANALVVPVSRDIDKKWRAEIAAACSDCVERGRRGRLTLEELGGSAFILSSLGLLGAHRLVARISRPGNAVPSVGAMLRRPWV